MDDAGGWQDKEDLLVIKAEVESTRCRTMMDGDDGGGCFNSGSSGAGDGPPPNRNSSVEGRDCIGWLGC